MQVLEKKNSGLDLFDHFVQRRDWVASGRIPGPWQLNRSARGDKPGGTTPLVDALLPALTDLAHDPLNARLFRRDNVDQRVARANQRFEFLGEFRGHRARV